MKKLLLIVFFLFCLTIFVRPALFGLDSYYYAALSCRQIAPNLSDVGVNSTFWNLVPCGLEYFKALICLIFGICLVIMYKTAKLFDEKNAEIFTLFFFLNPFLLQFFANMENDLIAAPFLFASLYFLLKWIKTEKTNDRILTLVFAGIGILFWKEMAVWFLLVLTSNLLGFVISIGLFVFFQSEFFSSLDSRIIENSMGVGLLGGLYLLFGIKDTPKKLVLPVIFSLIFAFVALKFALFAGLMLTGGAILFVQRKKWLENRLNRYLTIGVLLCFFMFSLPNIFLSTPHQSTLDIIGLAVKKANGSQIENDFWVGYMIESMDGNASHDGGLPDPDFNILKGIKITERELPCEKLGKIEEGVWIAKPKIAWLYDCG